MQIIWSICDKNFNLVRPALQFFPQKCHFWSKDYEIFDTRSKFWIFASSIKGIGTFLFEMSMKWMFRFKNFRNVYWHGKTHSALVEPNSMDKPLLGLPQQNKSEFSWRERPDSSNFQSWGSTGESFQQGYKWRSRKK